MFFACVWSQKDEKQQRLDTRDELDAILEQVGSLQKQNNDLVVKVAEAQDKQSELQLDKDHLAQMVAGLSAKRVSLLERVKALESERDKLQVL